MAPVSAAVSVAPILTVVVRNLGGESVRVAFRCKGATQEYLLDSQSECLYLQDVAAASSRWWFGRPPISLHVTCGQADLEWSKGVTLSLRGRSRCIASLDDSSGGGGRLVLYQESLDSRAWRITIHTVPDRSRWMAGLSDDARLTSLYLPGTHESAAIHGFPISSCQTFLLERQLEAGVRFLDIRLAFKNGKLLAYHGVQSQFLTAREAFESIYHFLESHPTETCIVSVKQENRAEGFDDAVWLLADERRDMWYSENRWPTLREVRGRAVMFCRFDFKRHKSALPLIIAQRRMTNDIDYTSGGLHPAYWPHNDPAVWAGDIGGYPTLTQDWYSIGSFAYIPEKAALVLSMFHPAASPGRTSDKAVTEPPVPPPLRINFASGSGLITAFPCVVARGLFFGLGIKGVNARVMTGLLKMDREASGSGGCILLLDYFEYPDGLVDLMIAWNSTQSR